MNPIAIGLIIFVCVSAAALFGAFLGDTLPKHHLGSESRDLVKMAMGLIATMTALVLGLMVSSAMNSFNSQRSGLTQMSANIILLDHGLAVYGPQADKARQALKSTVVELIQKIDPAGGLPTNQLAVSAGTIYSGVTLYQLLEGLSPQNDAQRTIKEQAISLCINIAQARWLLFSQEGGSIPTPFLVVLICWLMLIFASFGLLSPPNATVKVTLLLCALVASSAIFLILELDQPLGGLIRLSHDPLSTALQQLNG